MTDYDVLETMDRFGGSFIQGLARLFRLADHANKAKLKSAFPEYFEEYVQLTRQRWAQAKKEAAHG